MQGFDCFIKAGFLVNVILIMPVHSCLVSSRGIVDRPLPTNISCQLDIKGAEALQVIQRDGSVFINMDLNFVDSYGDEMEQIMNNAGTIIVIKRWVLAIGPKGVQLLNYPYNVVYLSLGTLDPGVETVSLNVSSSVEKVSSSVDCFLEAAEEERLDIVATSLARFQSAEGLQLDQAVCLESQHTSRNSFFDCWRIVPTNNFYVDKTDYGRAIGVLGFFVSLILTQYLSYFFLSFLCRTTPIYDENKQTEYISISTNLPIGPKYWLFFKGNDKVYVVRCIIYLSLYCFVSMILWMIYWHHRLDTDIKQFALIAMIGLIGVIYYLLLSVRQLYIWKRDQTNANEFLDKLVNESTLLSKYLKMLRTPPTGLQKARFIIYQTWRNVFTGAFWEDIWVQRTPADCDSKCRCILTLLRCIALVLSYTPCYFIGYYIASSSRTPAARIHAYAAFGGLILVCLLYPVVLFFCTVLYYFYVGLLTNSGYIFNSVLVSFIILGYVFTTVTDYYAGYVALLRQVIALVDKVFEYNENELEPEPPQEIESERRPPGEPLGEPLGEPAGEPPGELPGEPTEEPTGEPPGEPPGEQTGEPIPIENSELQHNLYTRKLDKGSGLTYINKKFFDLIIEKNRPYGPEIASSFIKLSMCCMLVGIGLVTLTSTVGLTTLNMEVRSVPFILIPFAIPILYKLNKNAAEEKNEVKMLKARITVDIRRYHDHGVIYQVY